jgi:lipoprotein-anchoring transpeptidase ErfK/SrfK
MIRVGEHGAPVTTGRLESFGAQNSSLANAVISNSFWRIAVLTAAAAIGTISDAEAALHYWSDYEPGFSRPAPTVPQRRQKARHPLGKKIQAPVKESAKPQGPLIIAISIEKQNMRIYDANGFFAETPVSTGMRGHPTPMGVFSIIQKHKFHRSNIYSGAPMPFMQRITWSGVAMHAGVLPGYPASHGCIRMPMAFATKMWGWTKMGARVVVTPGEMTPASFSHPLLATQKIVPQPIAADEPNADAPPAAKADKAADADVTIKPATLETRLELRSTVGHEDGGKPVMGDQSASTLWRKQTHTADAAGTLPAVKTSVTMSDAAPSARQADGNASAREEAARTGSAPSILEGAVSIKSSDASNADGKTEAARAEVEPANAERGQTASSDDKPVETKPSVEESASESLKPDETKVAAKPDDVKTETPKADAPKPSEMPDESYTAATDIRASVPDVKTDQSRLPGADKAAPSKPDPATVAAPKRTGQIAVLVSRKDSKLYVRQNFAPLFDVPVTIAPSDRPLGTHVFTAQVDKSDANVLHWSVVSLPAPARYAERRDEDEHAARRRKMMGAVEMRAAPLPNSPAEALDRLTIPADAMARISEALSTGGSIVVSDQGIAAGETGEGTDFIVSLR